MHKEGRSNKYRLLVLGIVLLWGAYFGRRVYLAVTMQKADGFISGQVRKKVLLNAPIGRWWLWGQAEDGYACAVVRFSYPASGAPVWYQVTPQVLSFREYFTPQETRVIFPPDKPAEATIYSLSEFWLPIPYIIGLLAITVFWSVGYLVVTFKPWQQM